MSIENDSPNNNNNEENNQNTENEEDDDDYTYRIDERTGFPVETSVIMETKTITFDREGQPTASVTLLAPSGKASKIAALMVTVPHTFPNHPALLCKTASVSYMGGEDQCAKISASYDCYNFPLTESVDIGVHMQTLPKQAFRMVSSGGHVRMLGDGEEPCLQVRTQEINRSFYSLNVPAWVYQNQGCVNNGTIVTHTCTCPAETLLYKGATASRTIKRAGITLWQINTKYSYNPNGWNKYRNYATGEWNRLSIWNNRTKAWVIYNMYPLADLSGGFN